MPLIVTDVFGKTTNLEHVKPGVIVYVNRLVMQIANHNHNVDIKHATHCGSQMYRKS